MNRQSHNIKSVNIPVNFAKKLSKDLGTQSVQYEFPFCELMPEQIVKNMLLNRKEADIHRKDYESSPVIHYLRRPGWNVREL